MATPRVRQEGDPLTDDEATWLYGELDRLKAQVEESKSWAAVIKFVKKELDRIGPSLSATECVAEGLLRSALYSLEAARDFLE